MTQGNRQIDFAVEQQLARQHVQEAQRHAGAAQDYAVQAQHHAQQAAGGLSDQQIQQGIQGMLNTDPATKPAHLTVQVRDGVVTLTGNMANTEAKKSAAHIAWRYPGVKDVCNQISLHQ